ncbi:branched-chain amino acid transport system II carrier protein [Chakrabartyella piscis]|uniref:branched-chain amino acid transport system II carrier protein n=1 Tax=Chakrabartyella piscis TaxID=2918914 RepID=UPI0029588B33|nr:branched-chain amino acid transport system II carrier protein [Chakrabartyella piscis]
METKKKTMDILVIGLALFAMFFGAGNLIFPPFLGMQAGESWFTGFLCFFVADVGLALCAILSMIRIGDVSMEGLTGRLGKVPSTMINLLIVLCIGPFLAIPRTAATTFEMAILPLFPNVNSWVFGAIFFGLVLLLAIRPSGVIDIIGKFLTPLLVICLLALIFKGYQEPIGDIVPAVVEFHTAKEGILAGYQTMDVLAAVVFVIIVISSAKAKGYTETKDTMSVIIKASLVAAVALFVVYGGLAFLGATTSAGGFSDLNQTALVVAITKSLMGHAGVWILAIIVLFACLTTAVGLTSSCSSYVSELTKGRLSYGKLAGIMVVFSYVVSNFGISTIIGIAAPILTLLYPVILVMIVLGFFHHRIENNRIHQFAVIFALVISALDVVASYGYAVPYIDMLPFAQFQCGWIVPAIIGGLIGKCFSKGDDVYAQEMA